MGFVSDAIDSVFNVVSNVVDPITTALDPVMDVAGNMVESFMSSPLSIALLAMGIPGITMGGEMLTAAQMAEVSAYPEAWAAYQAAGMVPEAIQAADMASFLAQEGGSLPAGMDAFLAQELGTAPGTGIDGTSILQKAAKQAVSSVTSGAGAPTAGGTAGGGATGVGGLLSAAQSLGGIASGINSIVNPGISPTTAQAQADPWGTSGGRAQSAEQLKAAMANPALAMSQPGYQFGKQQGTQALEAGAARAGKTFSPQTSMALQQWGQDYATKGYNDYINRLSGLAGATQSGGVGTQAAQTAQSSQQQQAQQGWGAVGQGLGVPAVQQTIGNIFGGGSPAQVNVPINQPSVSSYDVISNAASGGYNGTTAGDVWQYF